MGSQINKSRNLFFLHRSCPRALRDKPTISLVLLSNMCDYLSMVVRRVFSVKKYALGLASLVMVMALGVGYIAGTSHTQNGRTATFNGIVTATTSDCLSGGVCTVMVANKSIVTGGGLSANAQDNVYGRVAKDLKIGDTVFVKALKTSKGFTMQRCPTCYIIKQ